VVVASQPGSAAGSRRLSSWSTRCSHTTWPTSSASAPPSRCLRQIDQISGAYRSTICSQASLSPFLARVTRSMTSGSSCTSLTVTEVMVARGLAAPAALLTALRRVRPTSAPDIHTPPGIPGTRRRSDKAWMTRPRSPTCMNASSTSYRRVGRPGPLGTKWREITAESPVPRRRAAPAAGRQERQEPGARSPRRVRGRPPCGGGLVRRLAAGPAADADVLVRARIPPDLRRKARGSRGHVHVRGHAGRLVPGLQQRAGHRGRRPAVARPAPAGRSRPGGRRGLMFLDGQFALALAVPAVRGR
jgi:hypothetical protein